jgi:hypothetical protein
MEVDPQEGGVSSVLSHSEDQGGPSSVLFPCAVCHKNLPREAWSVRQWKNVASGQSKCSQCTEAELVQKKELKLKKQALIEQQRKEKRERAPTGPSEDAPESAPLPPDLSAADFDACVRVLAYYGSHIEEFQQPARKAMRVAMRPMVEAQANRLFNGIDEAQFHENKRQKREEQRSRDCTRALDTAVINKRQLRAARLSALESKLQTGQTSALLMIPDGSAEPSEEQAGGAAAGGDGDTVHHARSCYICKTRFNTLHFFYDQLCPECADLNWQKRTQTSDLKGWVCLVTGARVKIGYHCCLKLLRAGATVSCMARLQ